MQGRRDSRRKMKDLKMSYFGQENADSPPKAEPQGMNERFNRDHIRFVATLIRRVRKYMGGGLFKIRSFIL